jgi:hypothetical protein
MSLTQARTLLRSEQKAIRLLELDDLWTSALVRRMGPADRRRAAATGREMQTLLRQLGPELARAARVILADRDRFDQVARAAVETAPVPGATREALRAEYELLGWSAEVDVAFSTLATHSAEQIADIGAKIDRLLGDGDGEGDVWPWIRCCLRIAIFGLAIGAAIAAGGPAGALGMSMGASVLGLADGLPGCKGERRRTPGQAKAIEALAKELAEGRISELAFRVELRKILGLPSDYLDDRELDLESFHRGLKKPIPAVKPWDLKGRSGR